MLFILPLLVLTLTFFFCFRERTIFLKRQFPVMGTIAEITIYGKDHAELETIMNEAQAKIYAIQNICNTFAKNSELSAVNQNAFQKEILCSPLLWEIFYESDKFHSFSNGTFDVTIKPLMTLWGFYRKRNALPSGTEIADTMKKTGWNKVKLDPQKHSIRFLIPEIQLDLGGIAKGFALDQTVSLLLHKGIRRGLVNLGGNIRCFTDDTPFKIGIRDPKHAELVIQDLQLKNKSVATSGNYERYVVINGKRYTHIMNPKTGMPVSGILAVTVVTPRGVDSDALSTTIFIQGEKIIPEVLKNFPDTWIMLIRENPENPEKLQIRKFGIFVP